MENITIHQRLCEIQKQLKVGKEHNNSFGKYKYRKAEDILSGVKEFLQDNEYITTSANIQVIQDRFYVVITASFHKGNELILATGYARESFEKKGMDDAQLTGATTSYAKKYALCNLFAIDDEVDADDENYNKKPQNDTPKEPDKQEVQQKPVQENKPAVQSNINDFTNKLSNVKSLMDINTLEKELFDNKNLTDNERNERKKLIWGKKQTFKINERDLKKIQGLISDAELDAVNICNKYNIKALTELNYKQCFEVQKQCEIEINKLN